MTAFICKRTLFLLLLFSSLDSLYSQSIEQAKTKKDTKEQIVAHLGFVSSYNENWKQPNWVAWELTSAETEGKFPRNDLFIPDPSISGLSATSEDYKSTIYERGHMAPSADMKWSIQAMDESSYFSNICPQAHELNSGHWNSLEKRCRGWARFHGKVWICCGPIMSVTPKTFGENKVAIPAAFFKVVCTEKKGKYYAVGFIFPNGYCQGTIWDYVFTVDDIEEIVGHDFFYSLPDEIESSIESTFDEKFWKNN